MRVDHTLDAKDRVSIRWIGETQHDQGGTSAAPATVGRAMRGSRGPFDGFFGNLNDTLLKLAGLRTSMANTIQTVTGVELASEVESTSIK